MALTNGTTERPLWDWKQTKTSVTDQLNALLTRSNRGMKDTEGFCAILLFRNYFVNDKVFNDMDMSDRSGQQFGNYRLTLLLGQGGFADVYLGEHIYLRTYAAIKVLQTRISNESDLENFLNEARTVAHLSHPNIVRVLDFGVTDKTPFLVMDYAPNGTLRQRHPKGTRLPLPTIIPYVRQIADALQYAHDKKLVHRDIKPENMLLGQHNEVLLSDFGTALITQSSRNQSTQDIAGTLPYMSPEQIQGKPRAASDQYSLGIVVYEWLYGDHPFHGSFTELCTQHLFASPPSLTEKVPTINAAIEDILAVALAKDPKQRFRSISIFAHALQQAADEKLAPPSIYVPQLSNHQSPDSLLLSQLEPVAKVSYVPDPYQASAPTPYSSPQDPPRNAVLPSPQQHRLSRRFSWSVGGSLGLISLLIVLTLIFKLTAFVPGVPSTIQPTTNPTATSPTTGCGGTTNDNFSDSLQPVWTWTDPGGNATKSVSQGFLNITVPSGNDLAPGTNYNAPRLLQPINSTSFSAETLVKIPSNFTEGYKGAGLLFWQDTQNFLRLERGTGGIIFDQNLNGNYKHLTTGLSTTALQVELRLQRNRNAWTAFWREPSQTWQQVGTATVTLSPLSIGLTAIDKDGVSTVSAQYDYFRVRCN